MRALLYPRAMLSKGEARCSRAGNWMTREVGGCRRWTHDEFWYELYFARTPDEAIEKFLARQQQRLARLRQDYAQVEEQLRRAMALKNRGQQEEQRQPTRRDALH